MNQPPDPYPQDPQPPYAQPSATPYPPDYNQPGTYLPPDYTPQQPPTSYSPQPFPPSYPSQQPGQWSGYPPQVGTPRQGKRGWIIGWISAIVILIIAAAIITHGFRQEPPSGWLATYQLSTFGSKQLHFIHWTNQDGQLNGSWDEYSNGKSQSYQLDGTYDYQHHTVILNLHYNGQSATINGDIQGNDMTLHSPNTSSTSAANNNLTFHSASQQDYDNAKQNLNNPSY